MFQVGKELAPRLGVGFPLCAPRRDRADGEHVERAQQLLDVRHAQVVLCFAQHMLSLVVDFFHSQVCAMHWASETSEGRCPSGSKSRGL